MKFMLLMNAAALKDQGDWEVVEWPEGDLQASFAYMQRLTEELTESGELVMTEGLSSPGQAKLVTVQENGSYEVTDGPFPESKEFLVGFWVVDCESPERAYEIAARISVAPGLGGAPSKMPIEVRPVMSLPSGEM